MFILARDSGQWFSSHWLTYIKKVSEANSTSTIYQTDTLVFTDLSIISISFSALVGISLGCLLTLLWTKHKWQSPKSLISIPTKDTERTNDLLASRIIQSAVKNLISSQYVVKDREDFESLLQTPLRSSLEQLRLVADGLTANEETTASKSTWSSKQNHHCFYKNKNTPINCDVVNTINEQMKFMNLDKRNVSLRYRNFTSYSPVLTICPDWFGAVIRALLLNPVKHNRKGRALKIEISTSVDAGYFIVCISDNGAGLPSNITRKLNVVKVGQSAERTSSLLTGQEAINLASIKSRLHLHEGSLEVLSARQFLTKIIVKIPLAEQAKKIRLGHQIESGAAEESKVNHNLPKVLLISQQTETKLGNLQLLSNRFNLRCASSLEEGLRLVLLQKPDCIVFGCEMGASSVANTQRWLEQSIEFANVPIALLDTHPADAKHIAFIIEKVLNEKQRVDEQISEGIANYHLSLVSANNINHQDDIKFLAGFADMLKENYSNERFNRPEAAKLMLMTEKTLARRLHQHFTLGFTEKLRQFRLHQAKDLLLKGANVTTASYDSGFNSPSYFAQCFRAEFGFAPSKLCKQGVQVG